MKNLRNAVGAFLIFALLTTLITTVYNGAMDVYEVTPDANSLENGENIGERLENLPILKGMDDIQKAIQNMQDVKPSPLAGFDILGGLASVGAGVLKVIGGVVTFPISILGIIVPFFQIPEILATIIGFLFVIYTAFIILSAYLRSEV